LNKQPWFPNAERLSGGVAIKRLLPFAVFGAIAFSLASASNFHYFFRGYLLVLELQVGILLAYFLGAKLAKNKQRKNAQNSEDY
jgi:F0F1-type ATP synthase assembly protein I